MTITYTMKIRNHKLLTEEEKLMYFRDLAPDKVNAIMKAFDLVLDTNQNIIDGKLRHTK